MKHVTPVYIEDIAEGWATALNDLVPTIKANETAALGMPSLIEQVRYSKSSFEELVQTLAQADGGGPSKFRKYPLLHLVQDVTITRGTDVGLFGKTNLRIVLIHQTRDDYKIEDRDLKVFKPVLWPLYYRLLEIIEKDKWIFGADTATGEFEHKITKRAFWGSRKLEGDNSSILNDYVDALDITDLGLKINKSNC